MSHNTKISGIEFSDVECLKKAAESLRARGIDCELIENAIPRAYYNNQLGQADYVIKLARSRYDVGLYKEQNDKGQDIYVPECDLYQNEIANQIGVAQELAPNETPEVRAIGQFKKEYSMAVVEKSQVMAGRTVTRNEVENGGQLVINVAN